jgi:mono/diheme cytochrome c family protein
MKYRYSNKFRRKMKIQVLIMICSLAVAVGFIALRQVNQVSAAPSDMALVRARYPGMVGSRIDSCTLCHTTAPNLNTYGSAYLAKGRTNAGLAAVESLFHQPGGD